MSQQVSTQGIAQAASEGGDWANAVNTDKICDDASLNTITRVINVSICGSLEELSSGGAGRTKWAPVEGKHVQVFGTDVQNELGMDNGTAMNALRSVTVLNARILQSRSTFPVPLGVNVSCLPKNEIVETGDKYVYCVLPESKINTPYDLFKAGSDLSASQQWRAMYKNYNSTNLETEGILDVKACPYIFVNDSHPVIAVLRVNQDLIGQHVDSMPKVDNEWRKISRSVFHQCCSALRQQILNKLATHDLTNFQVEIERVGGQDWLDLEDLNIVRARIGEKIPINATNEQITDIEERESRRFISTPYEYHARIELTYELEH